MWWLPAAAAAAVRFEGGALAGGLTQCGRHSRKRRQGTVLNGSFLMQIRVKEGEEERVNVQALDSCGQAACAWAGLPAGRNEMDGRKVVCACVGLFCGTKAAGGTSRKLCIGGTCAGWCRQEGRERKCGCASKAQPASPALEGCVLGWLAAAAADLASAVLSSCRGRGLCSRGFKPSTLGLPCRLVASWLLIQVACWLLLRCCDQLLGSWILAIGCGAVGSRRSARGVCAAAAARRLLRAAAAAGWLLQAGGARQDVQAARGCICDGCLQRGDAAGSLVFKCVFEGGAG